MKVTKYPQSCLLVEVGGKRIIIDPGSFASAKYKAEDLLPADMVLITHEHSDHLDVSFLREIVSAGQVEVVANASAAKLIPSLVTKVVNDGDSFSLGEVSIVARELPHVLLPNGQPGPQNTGYVINQTFFHPGDGLEIDNLTVDNVAAPIAGPDISPKDVVDFVKRIGATTVIPIHYEYWIADPQMFVSLFGPEVSVLPLRNTESIEL